MSGEVRIVDGEDALYLAAAREFGERAQEAVAATGRYVVALSGGATPLGLFKLLAFDPQFCDLPWRETHVFWGDERHVPFDHPDSNYRMARHALFDHVAVPADQVHRVKTELGTADEAARDYEETLRSFFGAGLACMDMPRFDFALMGMGPDGHTASLFPHTPALAEERRLCVANRIASGERITLTTPVFNNAACVLFMVSGSGKAQALYRVLEGEPDPDTWPAQRIAPANGRLLWLVERSAAAALLAHRD